MMAEWRHLFARPRGLLLVTLWLGSGDVFASPADALRLLKTECFGCHNPDKKKGGLDLTSHEGLLRGGEDGQVIVPGKPNDSRLVQVLAADSDPHMPPKKQLTDSQRKVLRDWIAAGARWDDAALAEPTIVLGNLPANYQPTFALALAGEQAAFARGGRIWVYTVGATNSTLRSEMQGHSDAVQALAFSPDGKILASGGFRRLMLWESGDNTYRAKLEITNGLTGTITAVAFAPTGGVLVVAESEAATRGTLHIINTTNGQSLASWRAHADAIYDLDISRDGQHLVTAGGDRLVKVWDLHAQKEIATLEGHTAQVLACAFNSNATQVVSGGTDKELKVWDIATREKISTLGKHKDAITAVAWPGDAPVIYATRDDGTLLSYRNLKRHSGEQSSASGEERRLTQGTNALWALAVSEDGSKLLTGAQDGTAAMWDKDGKRLWAEQPPNMELAINPSISRTPRPKEGDGRDIRKPVPLLTSGATLAIPASAKITALLTDPPELHLGPEAPRARVLIGAQLSDGRVFDVTEQARYANNFSRSFEIARSLEVIARAAGNGTLTAHYRGLHADIPVRVDPVTTNASAPTFLRDVLPALSKAGCNAGACHAKPEGQNGFKLSVFSYDPRSDYEEIVKEARGRRVFPAAPDQSLLLKKPTASMPHEGGQRFEPGSETHQLLVRWISSGMPYSASNEAALVQVEVFPKSRQYPKGASQPLIVLAQYTDGSTRDVTRLAAFDSSDKEIVKVSDPGALSIGSLSGQAVVLARYMGLVADSHILVPSDRVLPAAQFAKLPRNNFVDDLAYAHFQKLGLFPSQLCTDAEFLRRAKLDAVGVLPTPEEVRAFLADSSPDKRRRFIAQVLDHPAYADYWANKWADLVRPNPDRVGVKSAFTLDQWLRASFRANKPYDQFAREILLAEGSNHRDGPAVIYRDRREPPELTTMFSQLFLGTRLECAKCHHHPNEKWSQDDFYQFAAFFGSVKQKGAGLSPPISAGRETFYFTPGGTVKHPVTGEVMPPRALEGPAPPRNDDIDPRRTLADWLCNPDNPYFAKAAVNRAWANFFGRGLVEPVDDFRISNPCVNPELLDALARDFARHGYDLKHLMRAIMESRVYQLSSVPNSLNLSDTKNFSRAYRRRLPAEVLLDAVNDATGVPSSFSAMPPASRALQTWSYKMESHFLDAFGRPNSSSDCPCERDTHLSVVQSLHLMNARDLQAKLADEKGRARQLTNSARTPEEIANELYLVTLNRFPTQEELREATAAFATDGATRKTATEDVFWALLNSAEFVLNH
jgi:WD40 repeat protein